MGWTLILDKQEGLEKFAGPGHWNDPDMLEVGNVKLTYNESVAHFSFWCLLAAPLMTGNDLTKIDDQTKSILMNKYAIEVNQDKLGIQGNKIFDESDFEVWSKKLSNNRAAMIFFNRNDKDLTFQIEWKKLGIKQNCQLFDVWKARNTGTVNSTKTLTILSHSVKFLILSPHLKI